MSLDEDRIEYIVRHLSEPDTLFEKEFVEWLNNSENQKLFNELLDQREALMRLREESQVDVELEYRRILSKINYKRQFLHWGLRVAAVVIFAIATYFLCHVKYSTEDQSVVTTFAKSNFAELILGDGQSVLLGDNSKEFADHKGVVIFKDSCRQLDYRHDTLREIPKLSLDKIEYHTLKIPAGSDYVIHLSDGTKVYLNCESVLKFPVSFAQDERRVFLDGEAFFEVEKSAQWPFIVESSGMNVRVTGTKFNVKSYSSDSIATTTLVAGAVDVESLYDTTASVRLTPSYQYQLNKSTGQTQLKKVDVQLYIGWTQGMFVFKNQRLEEIMMVLSRWYSMEVRYLSPSVKDLRLSANLNRYEHIDSLLEIIQSIDKLKIIRENQTLIIDWK